MALQQQLSQAFDVFGLGFGQAQLADQTKDFCFAQCRHRRWIGPSGKQGWGDLIDLFVGALGAEQHSDQQREGIAVIQRDWCFGVLLVQPADDRFNAFLLLHGCGQEAPIWRHPRGTPWLAKPA